MEQQQKSAASAFFHAHKDLFHYEKYVSNIKLCQTDNHQADNGTPKSFLEQYREIDCGYQTVLEPSELHFALIYPPTRSCSITDTTTIPSLPEFATLQATASILEHFDNPKHEQIPDRVSANSLQCSIENTLSQPRPNHTCESTHGPQHSCCDRISAMTFLADDPDRSRLPARSSIESKRKIFALPKVTEMLIDRETRAAVIAHRSWDEARKLEVLIGSKCLGRVSAASWNLPSSIRSRLRASANVSVRREKLYDLLHRDYHELSMRHSQKTTHQQTAT